MTNREILDVVYRRVTLAYEQNLIDQAPQYFKQLKEFIEEERAKKEKQGGWL